MLLRQAEALAATAPPPERAVAPGLEHPFRVVRGPDSRRRAIALPLLRLRPAAGPWSAPQDLTVADWVAPPLRTRAREQLFIAQVQGDSMEPTIPDGAFCLFERPWPAPKPREVGIFVRWGVDEHVGSFTLKAYLPVARDSAGGRIVTGALRGHNERRPALEHREGEDALEQPFARYLRVLDVPTG